MGEDIEITQVTQNQGGCARGGNFSSEGQHKLYSLTIYKVGWVVGTYT
jgi:hypothetical protein